MTTRVMVAVMVLFTVATARAWAFDSLEGRFSVDFPGPPTMSVENGIHFVELKIPDHNLLIGFTDEGVDNAQLYFDQLQSGQVGRSIISRNDVVVGGNPERHLVTRLPDGCLLAERWIVANRRFYGVSVKMRGSQVDATAQQFLDSFKLSGGEVADTSHASSSISRTATTKGADLTILYGKINNLGFGWPPGFDVFSGKTTPSHSWPWKVDPTAPPGTNRIMVGTSYNGHPPAGSDGYTGTTSRPANLPQAMRLHYELNGLNVTAATIQMFVDDFQAPVFHSHFQVTINGRRCPFLENIINSLDQTGPIGQLISARVPDEFLADVASGNLNIYIDDPTTGAGDGYAVGFVRLLINPHLGSYEHLGSISGKVLDAQTRRPLSGATVSAGGLVSAVTGNNGSYALPQVPAGLCVVTASHAGYQPVTQSANLVSAGSAAIDFLLQPSQAWNHASVAAITPTVQPPAAEEQFDNNLLGRWKCRVGSSTFMMIISPGRADDYGTGKRVIATYRVTTQDGQIQWNRTWIDPGTKDDNEPDKVRTYVVTDTTVDFTNPATGVSTHWEKDTR